MITARIGVLLAALGCTFVLQAQTSAQDYFNLAAHQYVKQDKVSALRTLDKALKAHPGDARLLKLAEELLKEQQEQQQQQQQQQQNDQQQKDQQQQDQPQKDQPQNGNDTQQNPQGRDDRDQQRSSGPQESRIAPQDAQRMLDAMDRQERAVQEKVRQKQRPVPRTPIEKDW